MFQNMMEDMLILFGTSKDSVSSLLSLFIISFFAVFGLGIVEMGSLFLVEL